MARYSLAGLGCASIVGTMSVVTRVGRFVRRNMVSAPPQGLVDETVIERIWRRAVSGPALLVGTPVYVSLLPMTLAGTLLIDAVRGQRWTATRFASALGVNLTMHVAAFAGVLAAWLAGGQWAGASPERERKLEHWLQTHWARTTWFLSTKIYGMSLEVRGVDCARGGPLLILPRHASLIDTLLPLVLLSRSDGLRLRYVMKRELLWDPILDALGHRWPTAFVRRGTHDPHEVDHIRHLCDDMGSRDAIVLFPEGTRFSEEKRSRILENLWSRDHVRFRNAQALQHVLPPHPSGVFAILDAVPVDVVFIAQTGLEGANHFKDLLGGKLIGSKVKVHLWRVPWDSIPKDHAERLHWLQRQWETVDRWIDAHQAASDAQTHNAAETRLLRNVTNLDAIGHSV